MILKLRPYQREALDALNKGWADGLRTVAVVLPTGLGKTVIFANLCNDEVRAGGKPLVLVHRDELVKQAVAKVRSVAPDLSVGVVKADQDETDAQIVVASVQTLRNPTRMARLSGVSLIVVDECHHMIAQSYVDVLRYYSDARVAGFTATLTRQDGKKLGDVIEKVVYEKDIEYGITHGYLCDIEGKTVVVPELDLASVKRRGGDYADEALAEALDESEAGSFIAAAYREHCPDRRGVLFAPSVAAARKFAEDLYQAGFPAEVVVGSTPLGERADIYARYEAGRTQILCSVGVLTEGWDAPWAEVAVMARPTRSQAMYRQCVGRVLRPWHGKSKALLLDLVGVAQDMSLACGITDLSSAGVEVKRGESLGEAIERQAREQKSGRGTSGLKIEGIDLFHKSSSAWLQTYNGIHFIPTRDHTWFIWRDSQSEWSVGRVPTKGGKAERLRSGMDMSMAMSWCEQYATEADASIASRKSSWRSRRQPPSDAQKNVAVRCGLDITGKSRNEVSDLLSIHFASRGLPHKYPISYT